jgi:hypothetical protein
VETSKALNYKVRDMQEDITNKTGYGQHQLSIDVSYLLIEVRNQWGFVYPFD